MDLTPNSVSSFIPLYIASYYRNHGLCGDNPDPDVDLKEVSLAASRIDGCIMGGYNVTLTNRLQFASLRSGLPPGILVRVSFDWGDSTHRPALCTFLILHSLTIQNAVHRALPRCRRFSHSRAKHIYPFPSRRGRVGRPAQPMDVDSRRGTRDRPDMWGRSQSLGSQ